MKIKLFREADLEWLENAVNEYLKPVEDARVDLHMTTQPANPEHNLGQVTVMVAIREGE